MGNTVAVVNKSNIILNTALCVIIRYYEANKVLPGHGGQWTGVGYVWFSVVQVPWFGPESEFGDCMTVYHAYVDRIPELAKNISESGSAQIGYLKLTGRNLTRIAAEERLRNMAYWGDGFKVAGYTLTFSGGPQAHSVRMDPHEIDLSYHFDKVDMAMSPITGQESNEIEMHVDEKDKPPVE